MAEDKIQVDAELQNLLEQIDNMPTEIAAPLPPPDLIPTPSVALDTPKELVPAQVIQLTPPPAPQPDPPQVVKEISDGKSATAVDLSAVVKKFDEIRDKLTSNLDKDREDIQKFIDLYAQQVQSQDPKTSFIEGLVSLLSVKATASANSIKILDSMAKMVASSRSLLSTSNQAVTIDPGEIDDLLANDFDPSKP